MGKIEFRLNEGLLIFGATTLALTVVYLLTKENIFTYAFILYAIGVWRFDRTVVVFKKGDADEVLSKDKHVVEKRPKNK